MTVWDTLRTLDGRWRSDDDRLWAQALGSLLVVGLTVRAGIHVWTALLASDITGRDIDPHLGDTDITLASPVVGLRTSRFERTARFATGVVGLGGWVLLAPLSREIAWVAAFTTLQVGVCLGDPVAGVVNYIRKGRTVETTNILET